MNSQKYRERKKTRLTQFAAPKEAPSLFSEPDRGTKQPQKPDHLKSRRQYPDGSQAAEGEAKRGEDNQIGLSCAKKGGGKVAGRVALEGPVSLRGATGDGFQVKSSGFDWGGGKSV